MNIIMEFWTLIHLVFRDLGRLRRLLKVRRIYALAHSREFAEALHPGTGGHCAVLLHHRAHLQVLLEDLIYVLHRGTAALRDALAPLAVNHVVVAAFFVGRG